LPRHRIPCPHCRKRGIGFFAKLLGNFIHPAVCQLCGERATKSATVLKIQMAIAFGDLAVVPSLARAGTTYVLGIATALIIIGVGQVGPMRKVLT
jgi:hypothetical protein